jgi:glycosyltransferase involved in cell wall biosynthesis
VHRLQKLQCSNAGLVKIMMNVSNDSKEAFFSAIDVLLIPSFYMETGPVVLLEAVYHGTLVLAPNTGSPVEFGAEFPELIQFYKWNNKADIVAQLQELGSKPIEPDYRYTSIFAERQQAFISKHIELYKSVLFSNSN